MRRLAGELPAQGHPVSHTVVGELLNGFSLQCNRKTQEGENHADRDAQFRYINKVTKAALAEQQPVISVDTQKKERTALNSLRRWQSAMHKSTVVRSIDLLCRRGWITKQKGKGRHHSNRYRMSGGLDE